jgi:hypothetical protein
MFCAMAKAMRPPKTITEIIDDMERIQGELLMLQRALEKLEPVESSEQESK